MLFEERKDSQKPFRKQEAKLPAREVSDSLWSLFLTGSRNYQKNTESRSNHMSDQERQPGNIKSNSQLRMLGLYTTYIFDIIHIFYLKFSLKLLGSSIVKTVIRLDEKKNLRNCRLSYLSLIPKPSVNVSFSYETSLRCTSTINK
jgi:hypothetical protein